MNTPHRRGYTLTEMLVALGVGMVVMQIAFTSFFFIQKFVRKIDRVDGMNQVAQSAILWTIGKPGVVTTYPVDAQVSQIGVATGGIEDRAATKSFLFKLHDFGANPGTDTIIIVPAQKN